MGNTDSSPPLPLKQSHVVIIGGGPAGLSVAKQLVAEKGFTITLIDKKEFYEHKPSLIGHLCDMRDPKFAEEYRRTKQVLYKDIPGIAFVLGEAVEVRKASVVVQSVYFKSGSKEFDFDFLVLAHGRRYSAPEWECQDAKVDDRTDQFFILNGNVRHARNLLIVGAGLVGVETAATILSTSALSVPSSSSSSSSSTPAPTPAATGTGAAPAEADKSPTVHVTLVSSHDCILPSIDSSSLRASVLQYLTSFPNFRVIYKTRGFLSKSRLQLEEEEEKKLREQESEWRASIDQLHEEVVVNKSPQRSHKQLLSENATGSGGCSDGSGGGSGKLGKKLISVDLVSEESGAATVVQADYVIQCTGVRPGGGGAGFLNAHYSHGVDAATGLVRVNAFLQVVGCTSIFAVGDCSSVDKKMQTHDHAVAEAAYCVKNILTIAQTGAATVNNPSREGVESNGGVSELSADETALTAYAVQKDSVVVALNQHEAVAEGGVFFSLVGWLGAKATADWKRKRADSFIEMLKKHAQ